MLVKELRGNFLVPINVPYIPAATGAAGGGSVALPNNFQIVSASMVWGAAITGTVTNFFTISFFNRIAGAGTVQWATAIAYSSGVNAAKATPIALTLSSTASELQPAAGDVLSVEITSTLTGLICPGGTLQLTGRWR